MWLCGRKKLSVPEDICSSRNIYHMYKTLSIFWALKHLVYGDEDDNTHYQSFENQSGPNPSLFAISPGETSVSKRRLRSATCNISQLRETCFPFSLFVWILKQKCCPCCPRRSIFYTLRFRRYWFTYLTLSTTVASEKRWSAVDDRSTECARWDIKDLSPASLEVTSLTQTVCSSMPGAGSWYARMRDNSKFWHVRTTWILLQGQLGYSAIRGDWVTRFVMKITVGINGNSSSQTYQFWAHFNIRPLTSIAFDKIQASCDEWISRLIIQKKRRTALASVTNWFWYRLKK